MSGNGRAERLQHDPEHNEAALGLMKAADACRLVTFRDFAALAKRRGWTPEFLAEEFKGKIEGPSEFFHRVLSGKQADVVIPYRSVLDFYHKELSPLVEQGDVRLCVCGCGRRVHGRKQYAGNACRKRMERGRSQTPKRGSEKANNGKTFSVTF